MVVLHHFVEYFLARIKHVAVADIYDATSGFLSHNHEGFDFSQLVGKYRSGTSSGNFDREDRNVWIDTNRSVLVIHSGARHVGNPGAVPVWIINTVSQCLDVIAYVLDITDIAGNAVVAAEKTSSEKSAVPKQSTAVTQLIEHVQGVGCSLSCAIGAVSAEGHVTRLQSAVENGYW